MVAAEREWSPISKRLSSSRKGPVPITLLQSARSRSSALDPGKRDAGLRSDTVGLASRCPRSNLPSEVNGHFSFCMADFTTEDTGDTEMKTEETMGDSVWHVLPKDLDFPRDGLRCQHGRMIFPSTSVGALEQMPEGMKSTENLFAFGFSASRIESLSVLRVLARTLIP